MNKVLELKKQIDEKLDNKVFGIIAILVLLVFRLVFYRLYSAIIQPLDYGDSPVFLNICYTVYSIVFSLIFICWVYIAYYYTIKKPLIKLNKYVSFILGLYLIVLFNNAAFSIIYNVLSGVPFGDVMGYIFNFTILTNTLESLIPVRSIIYDLKTVISSLKVFFEYLFEGYGFDGLWLAQALRCFIYVLLDVVTMGAIVLAIVLDVKPDVFASLFKSKKPADFVDYADLVDDKEITEEQIMNQEMDAALATLNTNEEETVNETPIDNQMVQMYLMTNTKYFPAEKMTLVKEKLESLSEEEFMMTSAIDLKDPTTLLLVSIFLGGWGIDRFMLGDKGMGILKLLTAGCCGVLTIIDWFTISKKTRERNFNKLMNL